jgi:hypothetical protein
MKKVLPLFLILASCNQYPDDFYQLGYDDYLFENAEKEARGDPVILGEPQEELDDPYTYCSAILKLESTNEPSLFSGPCNGLSALSFENQLILGNPETIFGTLSGIFPPDVKEKHPKRYAFYIDIARYRIKKRCAEPKPPESCQDKETMQEFGL